MIELKNITKRYRTVTAVDRVNLTVKEGCIYGLLGRNGAGKSTLLNVMANYRFPTEGAVYADGVPMMENDRALSRISYMSEELAYDRSISVGRAFAWASILRPGFDAAYAGELAQKFELNPKQKWGKLSTGYRSIANMILTLASGANYLLFDEPTLGMDANHRQMFYEELLARYAQTQCAVVLSTHQIEEVAGLVEHVVLLKDGKVLMDRPAEEMLQMGFTVSGKKEDVSAWCAGKRVLDTQEVGGLMLAHVLGGQADVPEGLCTAPLDLQQLFIHLTNS